MLPPLESGCQWTLLGVIVRKDKEKPALRRASWTFLDGNKQGIGGAEEDRTPDLRIANATLSQLSYRPSVRHCKGVGVRREGQERRRFAKIGSSYPGDPPRKDRFMS